MLDMGLDQFASYILRDLQGFGYRASLCHQPGKVLAGGQIAVVQGFELQFQEKLIRSHGANIVRRVHEGKLSSVQSRRGRRACAPLPVR